MARTLMPANPRHHRLARAGDRAHRQRRRVRRPRRVPVLRRRCGAAGPGWHRVAGRVLVVLGLAVAFSALWMTQFYPRQPGTGVLAYLFRLAFGSGMAASIVLGFTAIRRGDVTRHRAWMTRAYALALGAGTQVFTQGIGPAVFGTSELTTDLSLGAGWVINLAVAEYVIRRPGRRRTSRPTNTATAKVGSVMTQTAKRAGPRRLPAPGRRAPRPALVGLVR